MKVNTQFKKICDDMVKLHRTKSHDYADDSDPYLNFNTNSSIWGQPNWQEPLKRATEKMIRIAQLSKNNKTPKNEGIEDSIKDIAVLSIIAYDLYTRDKK